ncbi:RagB/SusD family nutrient uptake outer membrane protein [Pedobacter steynii]|uniref:SusD family protein n=1 Tax=Pedobacter steynii TaxID=430522 RepID=A0A1D7QKZ8_9SPHI|nr:RagB/SusD family nutrient uptake outer membrane protein [Pedobacter steynii]AOM79355.1 hypothetical protein BFS30_20585 [Pedobacter steynii]
MKKIVIILTLLIITTLVVPGCKKYLQVEPKSSISEKEMFTSEAGFKQALTGVYSQMGARKMYGDYLSYGFVSALAQDYTSPGSRYATTISLTYTDDAVVTYIDEIWTSTYTAIAGLNNILAHSGQNANVLSPKSAKLIRGEALGLRAYLHFDLLRLFGATFSNEPGRKAIPYQTIMSEKATVPSTTSQVIEKALADINEALPLLKEVDPILSASTNRKFKMNYYALKALQARILLYKGDKQAAFTAAGEVVNANKFPFVSASALSGTERLKDRLFSTELVFAIRSRDMLPWVEDYFKFNSSINTALTRTVAQFQAIYENSSTDHRYNYLIEASNGGTFPSKYWQTWTAEDEQSSVDSTRLDQTIPLLRISEMYYILAETASTPQDGAGYLNKVRMGRNIPELTVSTITTPQLLQAEITKEYQKEFLGEGQTFYYNKRINRTTLPAPYNKTITVPQYILPKPQSELEFNPNY